MHWSTGKFSVSICNPDKSSRISLFRVRILLCFSANIKDSMQFKSAMKFFKHFIFMKIAGKIFKCVKMC